MGAGGALTYPQLVCDGLVRETLGDQDKDRAFSGAEGGDSAGGGDEPLGHLAGNGRIEEHLASLGRL